MQKALEHRGPDGSGVWVDQDVPVALAHRRLAILDLSEAGAQPMHSASGRYVLTYNGEIYNFQALREALQTAGWRGTWRGHSDTEVLLAAFDHWGVEATLPRLDGMFALALWDHDARALVLARDRFGEKPLYYGCVGPGLVFGSELRALRAAVPQGLGPLNPVAVAALLRRLAIPAPLSIHRAVAKLLPGHSVTVTQADVAAGTLPAEKPYWSAQEAAFTALQAPFRGSEGDAEEALDALLRASVGRRLIADVPVGVMLSGGVDSASVCRAAAAVTSAPLKTYTVCFEDAAHDEGPHAAAVAQALGTDHTSLNVTADTILAAVTAMPSVYDEPFADASQVVTTALCRVMRQAVTVALSGDGGDELFGGYVRYRAAPRLWAQLQRTPHAVRAGAAHMLRGTGVEGPLAGALAFVQGRRGEAAERIRKAIGLIDSADQEALYGRLLAVWPPETAICPQPAPLAPWPASRDGLSFARRMMLADTLGYLPTDILAKVDRGSMASGLEVRAPFLDPALFSFAWSLPEKLLFGEDHGKRILRRLTGRALPTGLLDRPKQGFSPPIAAWLRGPLRGWADDLLREPALRQEGLVNAPLVARAWSAHRKGVSNEAQRLWPVLMLRAWMQR